jgi:hypothetical protein
VKYTPGLEGVSSEPVLVQECVRDKIILFSEEGLSKNMRLLSEQLEEV